MCDHIPLSSVAIKALKNRLDDNFTCLNIQVKQTLSKFNQASFKLTSDKVAIISNEFKKTSLLTSMFSYRILTLGQINTLDSVISLNRFSATHIIIDADQLPYLLAHMKAGTSIAKYKSIYIISDKEECDSKIAEASILLKNPLETQNVILCSLHNGSIADYKQALTTDPVKNIEKREKGFTALKCVY